MIEFDKIKELLAECEPELVKFEKGNRAAGTRVRKTMQEIKKYAQAVRERILSDRDEDTGQFPSDQPPQ